MHTIVLLALVLTAALGLVIRHEVKHPGENLDVYK